MPTNDLPKLALDGGMPVRTAPWPARGLFGEEEKQAALRVFDASMAAGEAFSYNGEEEEAYCREFAAFMGGGYADGVNSGSSALYVALRALELPACSEVIAPPVTDMGGVMPVPLAGLIPIPADTAPLSYNVGPDQIAERITPRTRALIITHIAGIPVDMDPIVELARRHNLAIIEDCAQAHGATYHGRLAGTFGDIAIFSTMSGKHHATGGQGGVVFTRREDLYWNARRISDRGKPFNLPGTATNVVCSLNLNSNDLNAAIGRVQLRKLPAMAAACRDFAWAVYEPCRDLKAVSLDMGPQDSEGVFWFLVFRLDREQVTVDLETFVQALVAEGLPFAGHYVEPFTRHSWYQTRNVFGQSGFPWTSPLYQGDPDQVYPLPNFDAGDARLFRLKIHERLTFQDAQDIAAALRKVELAYLR